MTLRRSREVTLRSDTADAPRRVMRGFSYSSHSVSEVAGRGWWVGWDGTYVLRGGESCCHESFLRFPGLGPTTPPSPAGAEHACRLTGPLRSSTPPFAVPPVALRSSRPCRWTPACTSTSAPTVTLW